MNTYESYFALGQHEPTIADIPALNRVLDYAGSDRGDISRYLAGSINCELGWVAMNNPAEFSVEHTKRHLRSATTYFNRIVRDPESEYSFSSNARIKLAYLGLQKALALGEARVDACKETRRQLTTELGRASTARAGQAWNSLARTWSTGIITELAASLLLLDSRENGQRLIPWPSHPRQDKPRNLSRYELEQQTHNTAWDLTLVTYNKRWEVENYDRLQVKTVIHDDDVYIPAIALIGGITHLGFSQSGGRSQLVQALMTPAAARSATQSLNVQLSRENILSEIELSRTSQFDAASVVAS